MQAGEPPFWMQTFDFAEGPAARHQTETHLLTARGNLLLVHESAPQGAKAHEVERVKKQQEDPTAAVRSHGALICVGCSDGLVAVLHAPLLHPAPAVATASMVR
ncbi:hypothetical protein T484DRAFT_1902223 [Baffinella frigidus]|nr:hypothetical protein T484DRAFT_1902223 [Cryptophyta sp. CCMP2293]